MATKPKKKSNPPLWIWMALICAIAIGMRPVAELITDDSKAQTYIQTGGTFAIIALLYLLFGQRRS